MHIWSTLDSLMCCQLYGIGHMANLHNRPLGTWKPNVVINLIGILYLSVLIHYEYGTHFIFGQIFNYRFRSSIRNTKTKTNCHHSSTQPKFLLLIKTWYFIGPFQMMLSLAKSLAMQEMCKFELVLPKFLKRI